ncbi:MAG: hypothetical protein KKH98_13460 [Spirochaetes bacterium]|nr:hypothetical protein [Spirochaetota bacterium]
MGKEELEKKLRPPLLELKDYPAKYITVASGDKMVVRQCTHKDVSVLLGAIIPLIGATKDFYDIVAARMYAEILGWYRYRVANEYVLAGTIDGEIVGIVNGRLVDKDIGMSYHTLAVRRGLRIGAHLFAAKMEYHLEYLKQSEVWIVAESPIGFRRWMIEYSLENRGDKFPKVYHELGGVPTYALTKKLYDKVKDQKVTGTRPVDSKLLSTADTLKLPEEYVQIPGFRRSKK